MNPSTVDQATFAELQATAGAEFVAELVEAYLEELPQMLAELRQAQAEGAEEPFRRAAHSIKSNCNTFGAFKMGEMARDLELGPLVKDVAAIDALDAEYALVATALKALCHV